ncbi:LysR substrate-binding domain-containing protein [Pseudonocardia nematodicida]|uniref:LysR substrate-binding domain-containing protein n=1 Tax=Pseudonocardia nematodicida TaxID=1206997 RepID=A0ABV1KIB5_9PSEU
MSFDLLDLRLLVGVVDRGSITGGAELVHLSLASASGRVAAMEAAAGVPLFDRHRRGVTPTRQGERLLAHARDVVERHERLRLELAELAGGHAATVTVLVNTAGVSLVTGHVVDFLVEHAGIDVNLVQQPSRRIVADLAAGRGDLGVLAGSVDLGRLERYSLGPDPLVVAVRPDHRLAGRGGVAFAEVLDGDVLVGHVEGSPLEELLRSHAVPLGSHPRHRARFPDAGSVLRAVAAGVGVAILPAREVGESLVGVPLEDGWAHRDLVVAVRNRAEAGTPVADLVDRIRGTLPGRMLP